MDNPDTALVLYMLVVISGIMLGSGWKPFLASISASGQAAATTAGSSATGTTGQHG